MKATPKWKVERIQKMAGEGLKQDDIAEALNISQWTVQKYDPRKVGRGHKKHLRDHYDNCICS